MRIALNGGGHHRSTEGILAEAREARRMGLAGYWLAQIFGPDSLTMHAVIGREVPEIELGTSILPVSGRHPLPLAVQAMTVQNLCGNRLILGIGPSHKMLVEGAFGESYERPYTRTREYLECLVRLLAGEHVAYQGFEVTVRGKVDIDGPAPPILIAALGKRMLKLAGERADGTVLWMVGPRTIGEHIAPRINEAAAAVGSKTPRIVAGVHVCVTNDASAAKAIAAEQLAVYGGLPAYRAMMDIEGVEGPEDLLIAGDEDSVSEAVEQFAEVGTTDLRLSILRTNEDAYHRTLEHLGRLVKAARSHETE